MTEVECSEILLDLLRNNRIAAHKKVDTLNEVECANLEMASRHLSHMCMDRWDELERIKKQAAEVVRN